MSSRLWVRSHFNSFIAEFLVSIWFSCQLKSPAAVKELSQVHWMTPKWPWSLQGQRYPVYVSLVYVSPKIENALNNLRMTLNISLSNICCIHDKYVPLGCKFWWVSLYNQTFSKYMYKLGWWSHKCTEWSQNNLKHLTENLAVKIHVPLYTKYLPLSHNCLFHSTTAVFKIQG